MRAHHRPTSYVVHAPNSRLITERSKTVKGRNMPAVPHHTFFLSETAGAEIFGFENRIMSLDTDSKQEN